jgi:hypothetical protein
MNVIRRLGSVVWPLLVGLIVLYAFFVALGAFAPGDVWALTVAIAAVTVLVAIHFLHVRNQLARGGPNEARRQRNALRERRGF